MHKKVLKNINLFKLVKVPRHLESQIQKCALKHLELKDMGQLRDRMEGQAYYDRLKNDILSEYAFETLIGITKFDWKKREVKGYKRNLYYVNSTPLRLIVFSGNELPKISTKDINNSVFVYVNPELRVYISGIAKKSDLEKELSQFHKVTHPRSAVIEYTNFANLKAFSGIDDLELTL